MFKYYIGLIIFSHHCYSKYSSRHLLHNRYLLSEAKEF